MTTLLRVQVLAATLLSDFGLAMHPDADSMRDKLTSLLWAEIDRVKTKKDQAYLERNRVVAALSKCFPAGVGRTAIEGWSDDWHGCVYLDLPTGQVSWHFHDSHAQLFAHLPPYRGTWDGHETPEKYARLEALTVQETWTTTTPTVPGWYWFREHPSHEPEAVEIWDSDSEDGLMVSAVDLMDPFPAKGLRGEWCRIQKPR